MVCLRIWIDVYDSGQRKSKQSDLWTNQTCKSWKVGGRTINTVTMQNTHVRKKIFIQAHFMSWWRHYFVICHFHLCFSVISGDRDPLGMTGRWDKIGIFYFLTVIFCLSISYMLVVKAGRKCGGKKINVLLRAIHEMFMVVVRTHANHNKLEWFIP